MCTGGGDGRGVVGEKRGSERSRHWPEDTHTENCSRKPAGRRPSAQRGDTVVSFSGGKLRPLKGSDYHRQPEVHLGGKKWGSRDHPVLLAFIGS